MADKEIKVLRSRNFNIVHLIFILFFLYLVIEVSRFASKEEIKVSEITEGSLTQNHNYTGLILREETIIRAGKDGYVKCYLSDGDRISKKGIIYGIDSTGDYISNTVGGVNIISEDQYHSLRKYMDRFETSYDGQRFADVYTLKDQLITTLYGIEQATEEQAGGNSHLKLKKAKESGLVFFTLDGYERVEADSVTKDMLSKLSISGSRVLSGDAVKEKQPVCKLISSEKWNIVVPVTEADAAYYANVQNAEVYLSEIDTTTKAEIRIIADEDQEKLAVLTLDDYMAEFAADRLINLQLVKDLKKGLKVPKSSVVSNAVFIIPREYGRKVDNDVFFYRRAGGSEEREQIKPPISYADASYYYLDDGEIEAGDIILQIDDNGEVGDSGFTVGDRKELKGVYNVNKGYAVFEAVKILDENDAYCIVESGSDYGLAAHDHIVLNASTVDEDDLLY